MIHKTIKEERRGVPDGFAGGDVEGDEVEARGEDLHQRPVAQKDAARYLKQEL